MSRPDPFAALDTIPYCLPVNCPCGNVSCVGKSPEERARLQAERARVLALSAAPAPAGPTYTDLAREVEKLRRDAADSQRYVADANARYLRMGQQQGEAELATALVAMIDGGATMKDVRDHLQNLLENDQ